VDREGKVGEDVGVEVGVGGEVEGRAEAAKGSEDAGEDACVCVGAASSKEKGGPSHPPPRGKRGRPTTRRHRRVPKIRAHPQG